MRVRAGTEIRLQLLAGRRCDHAGNELLGDPLLRQVRDSARAPRLRDVVRVGRTAQDDDAPPWLLGDHRFNRVETVHAGHAQVEEHDIGIELAGEGDRLGTVERPTDDGNPIVRRQHQLQSIAEQMRVVRDQNTCDRQLRWGVMDDGDGDLRGRIQKAILTGDNRLKQGVDPARVRESYEQALALAREAGIEETIRPLIEVRLADLARLGAEPPPPAPPAT